MRSSVFPVCQCMGMTINGMSSFYSSERGCIGNFSFDWSGKGNPRFQENVEKHGFGIYYVMNSMNFVPMIGEDGPQMPIVKVVDLLFSTRGFWSGYLNARYFVRVCAFGLTERYMWINTATENGPHRNVCILKESDFPSIPRVNGSTIPGYVIPNPENRIRNVRVRRILFIHAR